MANSFASEYKSLAAKLRGLDPVGDSSTVKQLKLAKGQIIQDWKNSCGNNFTFKGELEVVQREIEQDYDPNSVTAKDAEKRDTYVKEMTKMGKARSKKR